MTETAESTSAALYPIGAVASLTGLSPNTLRTWDRRYGVTSSARTAGGGRRYTSEDVRRLTLIRQVTKRGVAISAAAKMSGEELKATLGRVRDVELRRVKSLNVFLLHPHLAARLDGASVPWKVIGQASSVDQISEGKVSADLLFVDLDLLGDNPEDTLERSMEMCGAAEAIVLYHFARRELVEKLAQVGVRLVQEPVTLDELEEVVEEHLQNDDLDLTSSGDTQQNPEPRFLAEELARYREMKSGIHCECPNHLATLVNSLLNFEEYSKQCANRDPEDARLHRALYEGTGAARCIVEELLEEVIRHEDL